LEVVEETDTGGEEVIGFGLGLKDVFLGLGMGEGVMTDLEEVLVGGENEEGVVFVLAGEEMVGLDLMGALVGAGVGSIFCFFQMYWVGE